MSPNSFKSAPPPAGTVSLAGTLPLAGALRRPAGILCLSSTRWQFLWQRPQQLMSRLSRHYRVLFVDPPVPVALHEAVAQSRLGRQQLHPAGDSLWVLSPVIAADGGTDTVDANPLAARNHHLFLSQVRRAQAALGLHRPLLWVYHPEAARYLGQLAIRGLVYDCVDHFAGFSWASPETARWDRELVQQADLVLTSAQGLLAERRPLNRHTYLVPNAADFDHFARAQSGSTGGSAGGSPGGSPDGSTGGSASDPPELAPLARPRLGFTGAIYEWVDVALLAELAAAHPHWQIILIGPQQHGLILPQQPNLRALGPRDYQDLPGYLAAFDVCLIPFIRSAVTAHAQPIKLWEYLAAGKPVVTTRLPEIPALPGVVWPADSHSEFAQHCQTATALALAPASRAAIAQRARAAARNETWDQRCAEIRRLLRAHFNL